MTETSWFILTAIASGAMGRIIKKFPSLPKGIVPWAVLAIGYTVTLVRMHFWGEMLPWQDAAVAAYGGVGAGMIAVGGHESLKVLARAVLGESLATFLLGKLPSKK